MRLVKVTIEPADTFSVEVRNTNPLSLRLLQMRGTQIIHIVEFMATDTVRVLRGLGVKRAQVTKGRPYLNGDATEYFNMHNGERHARITVLRKLNAVRGGRAKTPAEQIEFDQLYADEAQWLDDNGIKYNPAKGWQFFK